MATTIVTKYGSDAPAATDIVRGELAVDTENGRLYTENSSGVVVELGLNPEGALTADAGIDIDNINIDGTTIALSSGDLTLDVAGDIILDADGGDVFLRDAGSEFGRFQGSSQNLLIRNDTQDKAISFVGNDGGVTTTALALDMAAAGFATFNNGIRANRDISAFGANTGSSANRMALSMEGSGVSRIICNGADGSTNGTFEVFTAYSGGTGSVKFGIDAAGAATFASTIAAGAATFTTADNLPQLTLISTDADANVGPSLVLDRQSASPADGDSIGAISFNGKNDAAEAHGYAKIEARIVDASNATEDGRLELMTSVATEEGISRILMNATETVINDNSKDLDFRVESDTKDHAFFVEGEGSSNRLKIGMGTGTITNPYSQDNFTDVNIDGVWGSVISFKMGGTEKGWIGQRSSGNEDMVLGASSGQELHLHSNAVLAQKISVAGEVTQPLQPAFSVTVNAAQSNLALNTDVVVVWGAENFDVGSNFSASEFTAPVTGKYQLNLLLRLDAIDSAADYYIVSFFTSNANYRFLYDPSEFNGDVNYWSTSIAVLADMDASDTVYITVNQSGGTAQTDVPNDNNYQRFTGYLVA